MTAQDETWTAYNKIKALKDCHLPSCCAEPRLTTIFHSLPNLRSVHVTLMTCPFTHKDADFLGEIWKIPTTRLLPRVATTGRFTAILSSLAGVRLGSLSHDRLPFEFFAQKPSLVALCGDAFRSLTRLSLTLDYSDMPNNLHTGPAFANLSACLRGAVDLRSFSLAMLGRRKSPVSDLLASLHAHHFSFPLLHTLKLEGVSCTQDELAIFLVSQPSLKTLQLGGAGLRNNHQPVNGGVHLLEGSFRELFKAVRKGMELDQFKLMGDLKSLEYSELWILDDLVSVDDILDYVTD